VVRTTTRAKVFPLLLEYGNRIVSRYFSARLKHLKRRENSLHSLQTYRDGEADRGRNVSPSAESAVRTVIEKGVEGGRYGRTTQFTLGKLATAIEAITFPEI
jgi:hypothetical protein